MKNTRKAPPLWSNSLPPRSRRLAAVLLLGSLVALASAAQPNVVLIIADDVAWDDLGCTGNAAVRTPNIDRLAAQGMSFERAFITASSCSPSRASILTGRYPHSTGAQELHWPLPATQHTFVDQLRAAGYWTAAVGKWHLGDEAKSRFDVVKEASMAGFVLPSGPNAGKVAMVAQGDSSGCTEWVPTLRERPRDKPFLLWLAALDAHRDYEENAIPNPHRPEEVIVPPYLPDGPDTRKDLALYYNEITRLDGYVGRVMAELEAQGVARDTVVIFLSDNGRPFPRCKTTVLDSGLRTPLIVRWPSGVAAKSVAGGLVNSIDLAPTILELAGLPIDPEIQGRSIRPIFQNPSASIQDYVFGEQNWHDYRAHARTVRDHRFRYLRNTLPELPMAASADGVRSLTFQEMRRLRDAGKLTPAQAEVFRVPRPVEELYDLETDPFELHNLIDDPAHAAKRDELRAVLYRWVVDTKDFIAIKPSPDEFDRESGDPLPTRVRPRLPQSPDRTY